MLQVPLLESSLIVVPSDLHIVMAKFVITTQAAVVATIRSQTRMGVRSTRALSVSLVLRLVFPEMVSLREIWCHLSGSDCPWIDEGKVEASDKVERQQSAVISILFGNNIAIEAVANDETKQTTVTSEFECAINQSRHCLNILGEDGNFC